MGEDGETGMLTGQDTREKEKNLMRRPERKTIRKIFFFLIGRNGKTPRRFCSFSLVHFFVTYCMNECMSACACMRVCVHMCHKAPRIQF